MRRGLDRANPGRPAHKGPLGAARIGLDRRELRRLRSLEDENARLKRVVADLTLDKHMLAEALRKKG